MKNNYAKTCKEVLEVLKYTPTNQLKMIPIEVLKQIKQISQEYEGQIKLEFDIMGEPKISHDAKVMILGIYRKYFITEKERKILNVKLQENENRMEEKKKQNYHNVNDIFFHSISKNERMQANIQFEKKKDVMQIEQKKEDGISSEKALLVVKKSMFDGMKRIFEKIKNFMMQK